MRAIITDICIIFYLFLLIFTFRNTYIINELFRIISLLFNLILINFQLFVLIV